MSYRWYQTVSDAFVENNVIRTCVFACVFVFGGGEGAQKVSWWARVTYDVISRVNDVNLQQVKLLTEANVPDDDQERGYDPPFYKKSANMTLVRCICL